MLRLRRRAGPAARKARPGLRCGKVKSSRVPKAQARRVGPGLHLGRLRGHEALPHDRVKTAVSPGPAAVHCGRSGCSVRGALVMHARGHHRRPGRAGTSVPLIASLPGRITRGRSCRPAAATMSVFGRRLAPAGGGLSAGNGNVATMAVLPAVWRLQVADCLQEMEMRQRWPFWSSFGVC